MRREVCKPVQMAAALQVNGEEGGDLLSLGSQALSDSKLPRHQPLKEMPPPPSRTSPGGQSWQRGDHTHPPGKGWESPPPPRVRSAVPDTSRTPAGLGSWEGLLTNTEALPTVVIAGGAFGGGCVGCAGGCAWAGGCTVGGPAGCWLPVAGGWGRGGGGCWGGGGCGGGGGGCATGGCCAFC